MTNKEFYRDEIFEIACEGHSIAVVNGEPEECENIQCRRCDFFGKIDCKKPLKEWLEKECKEPEIDWSNVPVDAKILVRGYKDQEWRERYFAKYKNGNVYVWLGGKKSNETKECCTWEYAKLAEGE